MALPMPCGMMRLQAQVQTATTARDEFGQSSETWLTVARVACHLEAARTADAMDESGVSERTEWRVVCAYHSLITTKTRLYVHDGEQYRTLHVKARSDPDNRRRRLVLECTEVEP